MYQPLPSLAPTAIAPSDSALPLPSFIPALSPLPIAPSVDVMPYPYFDPMQECSPINPIPSPSEPLTTALYDHYDRTPDDHYLPLQGICGQVEINQDCGDSISDPRPSMDRDRPVPTLWQKLVSLFNMPRRTQDDVMLFGPMPIPHGCRNPDDDFESPGEDLDVAVIDLDKMQPVPTQKGLREGKPFTMDSGAAESVADPDDFPEAIVEPSEASRAGRGYLGAGRAGDRIPNLGQFRARRMTTQGVRAGFQFQAAKVRKPLVAVSATADKGNPCFFDSEEHGGGCVIPSHAPELAMIRQLVNQIQDRIRLERQRGVYLMRNWHLDSPFVGQGS